MPRKKCKFCDEKNAIYLLMKDLGNTDYQYVTVGNKVRNHVDINTGVDFKNGTLFTLVQFQPSDSVLSDCESDRQWDKAYKDRAIRLSRKITHCPFCGRKLD